MGHKSKTVSGCHGWIIPILNQASEMAEAAGLVFTIAALFTSVVECCNFVCAASNYTQDQQFLACRFYLAQVSLTQWGKAVGFAPEPPPPTFNRLATRDPKEIQNLLNQLGTIQATVQRIDQASLKHRDDAATDFTQLPADAAHRAMAHAVQSVHQRTAKKWKLKFKPMRLLSWAVHDKQELIYLVESLEEIIKSLKVAFPGDPDIEHQVCSWDAEEVCSSLADLKLSSSESQDCFDALHEVIKHDEPFAKALAAATAYKIQDQSHTEFAETHYGDEVGQHYSGSIAPISYDVQRNKHSGNSKTHYGTKYGG